MQHVYRIIVGATVALVAGVIAVAAQDQTFPPMMQGMSQQAMADMMNMADHVDGRIAFLKAELKITDAQLPQWNNFADALRGNSRHMADLRSMMMQAGGTGQGPPLHAPDRLDRAEKMMNAMLESVRSTEAALGPLYAVLTEEQKKENRRRTAHRSHGHDEMIFCGAGWA
jgi:hypothetical protein